MIKLTLLLLLFTLGVLIGIKTPCHADVLAVHDRQALVIIDNTNQGNNVIIVNPGKIDNEASTIEAMPKFLQPPEDKLTNSFEIK